MTYRLLHLPGADGARFLQGQATCQVQGLGADGTPGAFCDNRGRIFAIFHLCLWNGEPVLRMHAELAAVCQERLARYLAFYKTGLCDISGRFAVQFATRRWDGGQAMAAICHADGLYEYWLPEGRGMPAADRLQGPELELAMVRRGMVQLRAATIDRYRPHDLSLDLCGAVAFDKGCYVGQEIVARTQYLGNPKKRLHRLAMAPLPISDGGTAIKDADGNPLGDMLMAAPCGDGGEVLAVLRSAPEPDSRVQVHGQTCSISPLPLPFVK